jgi:hypothetical protein
MLDVSHKILMVVTVKIIYYLLGRENTFSGKYLHTYILVQPVASNFIVCCTGRQGRDAETGSEPNAWGI